MTLIFCKFHRYVFHCYLFNNLLYLIEEPYVSNLIYSISIVTPFVLDMLQQLASPTKTGEPAAIAKQAAMDLEKRLGSKVHTSYMINNSRFSYNYNKFYIHDVWISLDWCMLVIKFMQIQVNIKEGPKV